MGIITDILQQIPDERADIVTAGSRTVAVKVADRIGVAHRHFRWNGPIVTAEYTSRRLTTLIRSNNLTEKAIGAAAINAQLRPQHYQRIEVFSHILAIAENYQRISVVGYFPFVETLRRSVRKENLFVFDLRDTEGCLPPDQQEDIIPTCDLIVISGSAFANGTLEHLLELSQGYTLVIGPTTPISEVLFEYGVDIIAGIITTREDILGVIAHHGGTKQFKHLVENVFMERQAKTQRES